MRIKRVSTDVGQKIGTIAIWMLGFGVLLTIWGGVWLVYLYRNPPDGDVMYFVATGILLSGIDLVIIGMLSGRIGRKAREQREKVDETDKIAVAVPEECKD